MLSNTNAITAKLASTLSEPRKGRKIRLTAGSRFDVGDDTLDRSLTKNGTDMTKIVRKEASKA
jgi:hypothetical protein